MKRKKELAPTIYVCHGWIIQGSMKIEEQKKKETLGLVSTN
jgi:hypothetical protein